MPGFVFADVPDAAVLLDREPTAGALALRRCAEILARNAACEAIGPAAWVARLDDLPTALAWSVSAQEALLRSRWPPALWTLDVCAEEPGFRGPRVRMGIATDRELARRIARMGHPGQILATDPPEGPAWEAAPLGRFRVRGVEAAVPVADVRSPPLATRRFPAIRGLDARQTNLPVPVGSFVGRLELLASLDALSDERLVTLLGPGGIGKTRSALRWAATSGARVLDEEGGVWFVDLADARTVEDVTRAVAAALGAQEATSPDAVTTRLAEGVATLLVLDNFETVTEHAATTVGRWLGGAPCLRILTTSREPVGLPGEHVVHVEPLSPDEATALLVARARAAGARFIADERAPELRTIAARLEGIPLAIELAAGRAGVLSPTEILRELDGLLDVRGKGRHPRHTTLRAAIGWSWDRLGAAEREALATCAVFRGGFDRDAARALLGGTDTLDELVARSLVQVRQGDTDTRYGMLESVRAFVTEMPRDSDFETRDRHAAWYGGEAARRVPATGAPNVAWAAREDGNLLAAWEHATDRGAVNAAVALALAVDVVLQRRGPNGLRYAILDRTRRLPLDLEQRLRVETPWAVAALREGHGADVEAAVAAFPDRGPHAWRKPRVLGFLAYTRGDLPTATARFAEAASLARDAGDRFAEATCCGMHGSALHLLGDLDGAERALTAANVAYRAIGAWDRARTANGSLLQIRTDRGEAGAREELARHVEDLRRSTTDDVGDLVASLCLLADASLAAGRAGEARVLLEEALPLARRFGWRRHVGNTLGILAQTEHHEGHIAEAIAGYDEALRLLADEGPRYVAHYEAWRTLAELEAGRPDVSFERARSLASASRSRSCERVVETLALATASGPGELAAARARLAAVPRDTIELRCAVDRVSAFLERRLAQKLPVAGDWRARADAAVFRSPDGKRVDLTSRSTLRRMAAALVAARIERPGQAVSASDLLSAAWPGERVLPAAAHNRLHVALSTLRQLGLQPLLVRAGAGYRLEPDVPLVISDAL